MLDATELARATLDSLDVASASADVIDESAAQFRELTTYLNQLSTRTSPTVIQDFVESLHSVCPLVDEADMMGC